MWNYQHDLFIIFFPFQATLCCFSGAYCASTYENNVRATKACQGCQEPEPADLRFLPCTRFSAEYQCLSKLQFAIGKSNL